MSKIDTTAEIDGIRLKEVSVPSTPASGYSKIYGKTDGKLYFKNDGGNEYDLTQPVQIETDSQSTTYTLDWAAFTYVELTLTGDVTISFSNLVAGRSVTLLLIQDGTGGRSVTWPGAVNWINNEPDLQLDGAAIDVVSLFIRADGTTVEGFSATWPHLNAGKARELTIAAGVITVRPIDSHIMCDTQADAGSDDLDTINGGIDGQMIVLHPVDNVRDIVVKHATGNIRIKGTLDATLAFRYEYVLLVYFATPGFWMAIE